LLKSQSSHSIDSSGDSIHLLLNRKFARNRMIVSTRNLCDERNASTSSRIIRRQDSPGLFIKCDLVAHTAFATTAYLSWSSRVQISALSSPLLPNFRTYEKRVRAIFARNGPQSLESADDDVSLKRTSCTTVCLRLPPLLSSITNKFLNLI